MAEPMRSFRCPDGPWEAAKALAQARGTSLNRELIRFLELYSGVPAEPERVGA
jgi:hypothetical protein